MSRQRLVLAALLSLCLAPVARAEEGADQTAIRQTALDYIEGWYDADAVRMERALHPELAKRSLFPTGLDQRSAMTLVNSTKAGGGKWIPRDTQQKDVTILDVYGNAASVKVVATGWIDYLHMIKVEGQWKIVNVLWEFTPEMKEKYFPKKDP